MFSGNNLVIEYNHVRHMNLETEDTGAVYTGGRDWISSRGTIIRYNLFHDMLGFGKDEHGRWVSSPLRLGSLPRRQHGRGRRHRQYRLSLLAGRPAPAQRTRQSYLQQYLRRQRAAAVRVFGVDREPLLLEGPPAHDDQGLREGGLVTGLEVDAEHERSPPRRGSARRPDHDGQRVHAEHHRLSCPGCRPGADQRRAVRPQRRRLQPGLASRSAHQDRPAQAGQGPFREPRTQRRLRRGVRSAACRRTGSGRSSRRHAAAALVEEGGDASPEDRRGTRYHETARQLPDRRQPGVRRPARPRLPHQGPAEGHRIPRQRRASCFRATRRTSSSGPTGPTRSRSGPTGRTTSSSSGFPGPASMAT